VKERKRTMELAISDFLKFKGYVEVSVSVAMARGKIRTVVRMRARPQKLVGRHPMG
jgi:hypothetical protein